MYNWGVMRARFSLLALLALLWPAAAQEHTPLFINAEIQRTTGHLLAGVSLKCTRRLDLPEDIIGRQWRQLDAYFRKRLAETPALRDRAWRAAADPGARRARLETMLGARVQAQTGAAHLLHRGAVRVEELEVPTDTGGARALLFVPPGEARPPVLIAIPPDETPRERFAGVEEGSSAPAAWLTALLARGVAVAVMSTVERTRDHPLCQRTRGKDRRHILHRLAFVVGRTAPGIEAGQARALAASLAARSDLDGKRLAIAGFGQGGMTALLAAALDERFTGALVGDYFDQREDGWQEPVDRMLYGQLLEFGDAELAAMIAPRKLILLRGNIPAARFAAELGRARRLAPSHLEAGEGQEFDAAAAEKCAALLGAGDTAAVPVDWRAAREKAACMRDRHFEAVLGALRAEIDSSEAVRRQRWGLETATPATAPAKAEALRKELVRLMGQTTEPRLPLNPRTRLIRVTDKYLGFDVLLDVIDGVEAYGQLLVPRGAGGRLPAVVAQHGLGGQPKDITTLGPKPDTPYHGFGAKLAEEGYVVFAPYVVHPIPQAKLINPLVRMAGALGRMRVSPEVTKLNAIVDFLSSLPWVDPERIGYYGLSYGGYSAIWMGPRETRLKAVVVSGHFNDWRTKITNDENPTSYLLHPDEDFYNWDVLRRFTHVELLAAMYPRAACVEFAERDGTTTPAWHERSWREVERVARAFGAPERFVRDHFDGVHEIQAVGALEFLNRWLRPELPAGRDYRYPLWPSLRPLPGLGDIHPDTFPYETMTLTSDQRIRGAFHVTAGQPRFQGIRIRVSRTGQPGPLVIRYGTREGAADLGEARIPAERVYPLYDLWVEAPVAPRPLTPGRQYHFEVAAASGKMPRHFYTIYGPKLAGGKRYPEQFALSFRLLDGRPLPKNETFAFLPDYLGPYRSGADVVRRAPGASGGVRLSGEWKLETTGITDEPGRYAADDLRAFLKNAFGIAPAAAGAKTVHLRVQPYVKGVIKPEGYRIEAGEGGVVVLATTGRGLLRGVFALEDEMRDAGAPLLRPGVTVRNPRLARRITTSIIPGGERYTETSRELLYTDGLLERIAHDGFNGVWIWLNVEEATVNSRVLPELSDEQAQIRLERVQDLARRARRYGIDVYAYLATGYHHWIPESFFEKYPELRGYGAWARPLCTSQKKSLDYYDETVRTIFRVAPDLKGLVAIYDSEGFYYCGHTERTRVKCPRCRQRTNEELAREVLTTLMNAMRAQGGPDKEFIAWDYGDAEVQSTHLDWINRLLPQLPKGMMAMTDFSKNGEVERDGVKHFTGDYNLTLVGPPQQFLDQQRLTTGSGNEFIAKTEHAISQEFIFVPYIPAMEQWARRIDKIREFTLGGWFGNWCHYGYTPSTPARLINRMSWDPAPASGEALETLARARFGAAAPRVRNAWRHFSEGIREFPYSDRVARTPGPLQKGPSNPFFLDASVPGFGRWRAWQNDLHWTEPWGPAIATKYLRRVLEAFQAGIGELEQGRGQAQGADREALDEEWRIARTIESSLQSTLHLAEWIRVRDLAKDAPERYAAELRAIALRELANARGILPVLEADSRLGHASEGGGLVRGGLFTPDLVRWKTGMLEDLLVRQLPAFGKLPVELPPGGGLDSLVSVH